MGHIVQSVAHLRRRICLSDEEVRWKEVPSPEIAWAV